MKRASLHWKTGTSDGSGRSVSEPRAQALSRRKLAIGGGAALALLAVVAVALPFGAGTSFAVGDQPRAVATGHFNDDDQLDLAVANLLTDNVTILLGNASGGFAPAVGSPIAVGDGPSSIATGHFDDDADLDLAVGNFDGGTVSILLGDGNGGFVQAAGSPIAVGSSPLLSTGYFDDDTDIDLAVAHKFTSTLSVLLGNGNGTFAQAAGSPFPAGNGPQRPTAGLFDDDTNTDLALCNAFDGSLSILRGNGLGGFSPVLGSPIAIGGFPTSVATGHFDDDADLDLAVTDGANDHVSIWLGNGLGGFSTAPGSPVATGGFPIEVTAGCFDADADIDLVVVNVIDDNVTLLLGNGLGGFSPAPGSPLAVGNSPQAMATGYFDDDTDADLAVVNSDDDTVTVLLDAAPLKNGDFALTPAVALTGDTPLSLTTGYFDDDTDLDLATANRDSDNVTILLGVGNGTFGPGSSVAAGDGPNSIAAGYFDDDADLDLATANTAGDNVSILLGSGNGTFTAAPGSPFATGDEPSSIATGLFNDDADLDLATANDNGQSVSILLGNGDGTFAAHTAYAVGTDPHQIVTGHFDDDPDIDIAVIGTNGRKVSILLGNGDGAFALAPGSPFFMPGIPALSWITTGCFDGDADLDLAVSHSDIGSVGILLGNGNGTFTSAPGSPFGAGGIPTGVVSGHFDGDAELDLVVGISPHRISILFGNGDGTFAAPLIREASNNVFAVTTGYFNDDGALDIAFCDAANDLVKVMPAIPGNQPPVAHAGADKSVQCAGATTQVVLDGSGTSDPDADTLNYAWSEGAIGIATGASPTVPLSFGSHAITLTVTDPDGLVSTDGVTIDVVDTTPPVITITGANPMTVECHTTLTDPGATANDACAGPVAVTTAHIVDVNTPGTYLIHYFATVGQTESHESRTVHVVDTTAPEVWLNAPGTIDVECHTFFIDPGAMATDTCGVATLSDVEGQVDVNTPGSYEITYTFSDGANEASVTRTVNVIDTMPPVVTINGPSSMTIECHSGFVDMFGASATDLCAGMFFTVGSSGNVDANTPGTYTITYSATDGTNEGTAIRTVNVVDTTAPTITLTGGSVITVQCHSIFTDPGASASDLCSGVVAVSSSGGVDASTPGSYTISYTATDGTNETSATRTVHVVDTMAPVITIHGASSMTVECHTSFVDPGASANDACSGVVAVSSSGSVDANTPGSYTITYTATDGANGATATRTVNVVDTTAPTITIAGSSSMTVECHTSFIDPGASANDTCSGAVAVTSSGSVDANTPGSYTITYTATDGTNGATATRTVNVVDTTAPTITLTTNAISLSPPNHKYVSFNVGAFASSASDGCDSAATVSDIVISSVSSDEPENANGDGDGNTLDDIVIAKDCGSVRLRAERSGALNGRVYTITLKVKDAAGNVSTATRKVSVPVVAGGTATDSGAGAGYTVSGCSP